MHNLTPSWCYACTYYFHYYRYRKHLRSLRIEHCKLVCALDFSCINSVIMSISEINYCENTPPLLEVHPRNGQHNLTRQTSRHHTLTLIDLDCT